VQWPIIHKACIFTKCFAEENALLYIRIRLFEIILSELVAEPYADYRACAAEQNAPYTKKIAVIHGAATPAAEHAADSYADPYHQFHSSSLA
jgi:hypothetical protein